MRTTSCTSVIENNMTHLRWLAKFSFVNFLSRRFDSKIYSIVEPKIFGNDQYHHLSVLHSSSSHVRRPAFHQVWDLRLEAEAVKIGSQSPDDEGSLFSSFQVDVFALDPNALPPPPGNGRAPGAPATAPRREGEDAREVRTYVSRGASVSALFTCVPRYAH